MLPLPLKIAWKTFFAREREAASRRRRCRVWLASPSSWRFKVQIADELATIKRRIAEIVSGAAGAAELDEIVATKRYGETPVDAPLQVPAGAHASRGEIGRIVAAAAARRNVDPALIEAVIENESGFDERALSSAGARGLMQLMPATAADPACAMRTMHGRMSTVERDICAACSTASAA